MVDTTPSNTLEYTLEDGAWKDSFDKLLEPRPILRELNVLKPVVHASFNRDSSVENSVCSDANISGLLAPPRICYGNLREENNTVNNSISTPVTNRLTANPFKCSLSPIGAWQLRIFDKGKRATESKTIAEEDGPLHGTPINPRISVVVFDESNENEASFAPTGPKKLQPVSSPQNCFEEKRKKFTRSERHVCFQPLVEKSTTNIRSSLIAVANMYDDVTTCPTLNPGKWRKSLSAWRRNKIAIGRSSGTTRLSKIIDRSVEVISVVSAPFGERKSIFLKTERQSEAQHHVTNVEDVGNVWEHWVLERCKQEFPIPFEEVYPADKLKYCQKIGEGAYGEVFLNASNRRKILGADSTVMKVIPIEGDVEVNGELQKTYQQILSEIVISEELSKLQYTADAINVTPCFVAVKKIVCIKGKYPAHFITLWEDYENENGSDNDHPKVFGDTQIYLVLELKFGGRDMEKFQFLNAEQGYYALQQIVLTLAVAEESMQFEHRDLHWGNVLIVNTNMKALDFKLNNRLLSVPTKGIKVTIIDYTLSRMTFDDCCHYNDLANDEELFTAFGDYQYDIYRMMRDILKNNWEEYNPKTNIFWISYIIKKLSTEANYKNTRTKTHTLYMNKLLFLMEIVLDFNSAKECAEHLMTTAQ